MTIDNLVQKVHEIGNSLLEKEKLSKEEIDILLATEFIDHYKLIRDALCSLQKIDSNPNKRIGGLVRVEIKKSHSYLTSDDKKVVNQKIEELWYDYQQGLERKNTEKPEEAIENAFHTWLKEQNEVGKVTPKASIINFRSYKRTGAIWENVDGYAISIEESKFHLSFKPILTTFEVKAKLPDKRDIRQAREYAIFSHYVYLVFKYDGTEDELKKDLLKDSIKYDSHEGIGVYFTNDGKSFKCCEKSKFKTLPLESEVDKHINRLLLDEEKDILLRLKHKYILNNLTPPQNNY